MSLTRVFRALADETRRQILQLLQEGDLTAGEIAAHFELSWPTISHHLNVLKQAHLVQDYRKGQHIYYSLNTTVFQEVMSWVMALMAERERKKAGEAGRRGKEKQGGEGGCRRKIRARTMLSPGEA
ncbi:transcriptional regulator, ArsR family [Ammonifex degensii KC4]|uniref:Transcriptional regulator, ArsR family n=1 Tax=Ammonifex degensii (strain DSM 10501 / KC4) TaxID=429009 RepID=C9R9T8_AMMDK|nr:autorepressor SdpR family transcription factor [Ammonifex degensii]ACX53067.1 transcriptional regulator, ArsR family [Ammonifex degensii KC4]